MYGFLLIFELPKINFCQTRLENLEDTIFVISKFKLIYFLPEKSTHSLCQQIKLLIFLNE